MSRVGVVGLVHESNTYSPRVTTLESFAARQRLVGRQIPDQAGGTSSVLGGFLLAQGFEVVPVFAATAWPGGPADEATADTLLGDLGRELHRAGPLDGVLLDLHGAMIADGHADMDADIVHAVRVAVGTVPVAAVVDLHANPTAALVRSCEVIIGYDEYPHVDVRDRGVEAAALMAAMLTGRRLRTALLRLPLLTSPLAQSTAREPMRGLQSRARALAERLGVARVSLTAGFPYCDSARAGFGILAVHDQDRQQEAHHLLELVAGEVALHEAEFKVSPMSVPDAVSAAVRAEQPVVLVDVADNIGAGGPGDGTALLPELLRRGVDGTVVTITDAAVAEQAAEAGPGAELRVAVGGKSDDRHGAPVPMAARVATVSDGRYRSGGARHTGQVIDMGTTAVLCSGGTTVVVTERPTPPFHAEQLLGLGIDASDASVITAKSAVAWRSAFGSVVHSVIEVDTPGVCPADPWSLERTALPHREQSW